MLGPSTGLVACFGLALPSHLLGLRDAVSEWEEFRNKGQNAWVLVPALSFVSYVTGKGFSVGSLVFFSVIQGGDIPSS